MFTDSDLDPRSAVLVRCPRRIEHALLRQAILKRRGVCERAAIAIIERTSQGAAEEERPAAEGTAGRVAFSIGASCACGNGERLATHGCKQLFADEAHCPFFAVNRDGGRLVGTGCNRT